MDVARRFGMVQPAASDTQALRAVSVIDPQSKVLAILYYPLSNGRNFLELKRRLIALQTSDAHGCATPADWQPGGKHLSTVCAANRAPRNKRTI